jgi:hypothetical protein
MDIGFRHRQHLFLFSVNDFSEYENQHKNVALEPACLFRLASHVWHNLKLYYYICSKFSMFKGTCTGASLLPEKSIRIGYTVHLCM